MSQPAQNQQHTKPSTTPKSDRPQPNNSDAFTELAEALVSAQAYLNNPKAEKTSTRREPVRLVPDLNSLPRPANQAQDAASFASSLPKATFDPPARSASLRAEDDSSDGAPCRSGLQPRQEGRVVSASSRARSEGGGSASATPRATDSRASAKQERDASLASLLPQAASNNPARSAVSPSRVTDHEPRATGHASRAASHRPVSTVRQAKNYLRASRSPQFLRSTPDLQRHRRKCAICRHPEREMIEELFIHWHSPAAIANFFRTYEEINWVSIYRHAYAFGLDQIRRRNLHHFFENLLDDAIEATPTFAGVLGAARALACVTEDGCWVEPEKRILMTTLVRKEDASGTTSTDAESLQNSASQSDEIGRVPFTSLPKAAVDQSVRSTGQFGSPAAGREPRDVPSSTLPQAAPDIPAAACPEPRRGAKQTPPGFSGAPSAPTSHEPRVAEHARPSASREIRLSPNSHKTKEKTISNR